MAKLEELVLLVNSLSKAEKRYFKLFTSIQEGDKYYLALFSFIEKGLTDRIDIKQKFAAEFPKGSFEVSLKYLLKVILKSLRYSESQEQIEVYLLGQLLDIRQLYKKGVYGECLSQIKKIKELAVKHEKSFYFLEASSIEMEYYTRLNLPGMTEEELLLLQNTRREVLDTELNVHDHLSLYQMLLHRFTHKGVARSEEDMQRLNDLVLQETSLMDTTQKATFQSQQMHMLFQSVYFKVIGSPELSLEIYYDLDTLFQKNELLWEKNPLYYVFLLEGILLNLISVQEYASIPYFIDRLKKIRQHNQEETQIDSIIYQFELVCFIGVGDFKQAEELITAHKHFVKSIKSSGSPYALKIDYYQSLVYFGLEDWKSCLRSLNYVLRAQASISNEYQNLSRLVALLVHYELEDYDYLEYEIRGFERKLKKQRSLHRLEKCLFDTLRHVLKAVDEAERKKHLMKCKETIERLREDRYEGRLITLFDFTSWLEAKITRKPFVSIVQKNYSV